MKNLSKAVLLMILGTLLAGCSMSQQVSLFPVEGPYAAKNPTGVLVGTAHDVQRNSGRLELTLHSGATCNGKWSSVAPQMATITSGSLLTTYGSVVGLAVTSGPLPGVNRGEAIAVCTDGTRIEMEFLTGSGTANGYGVAKDNHDNIFKMLF